MPIVAGTRLRLRSAWLLPVFFWNSIRSMRQARSAPGFLGGRLLQDKNLAFWTLTAWASDEAMQAYRNKDPHRAAMARSGQWCDELVTAHWAQDGDELPGWPDVVTHLAAEGRFLKLPSASPRQLAREVPPPGTKNNFDFAPKK